MQKPLTIDQVQRLVELVFISYPTDWWYYANALSRCRALIAYLRAAGYFGRPHVARDCPGASCDYLACTAGAKQRWALLKAFKGPLISTSYRAGASGDTMALLNKALIHDLQYTFDALDDAEVLQGQVIEIDEAIKTDGIPALNVLDDEVSFAECLRNAIEAVMEAHT